MSLSDRTLWIAFESAEDFRREYECNLSNGGIFVATDEPFELREAVQVELDLRFARANLRMDGEVVHIVPREISGLGATCGVAVQLRDHVAAVRERIAPYLGTLETPEEPATNELRSAPRRAARVAARIDGAEAVVDGRTRDLSKTGVLVGVSGPGVPVGEAVRLTLCHPTSGQERAVDGQVVRQIGSGGDVHALAIRFAPSAEEKDELEHFVDEIQRAEHARRLGGICGPIEELGLQNLLQMFGQSASEGTLTLRRGHEEGGVGFERGLIRFVRVGGLTGLKALLRLLSWRDGSFEFHAHLEEGGAEGPPLPLEAALLEAARQIDEERAEATRSFPMRALVSVRNHQEATRDPLSKVEEAILDLAQAGSTVQRLIDVIPEPDPEILRALGALMDAGLVEIAER